MEVTARPAGIADILDLVRLYRALEHEMVTLKPVWSLADGLAEPAEVTLGGLLDDPASQVWIGLIDGVPLGFLWARIEPLLPQADGAEVGVVHFIFTEPEARRVGVGEAMLDGALAALRERSVQRFDARVSPGHRDAKNFFESFGFSARLIVMFRDEAPGERRTRWEAISGS
jgi:GNAT superfamily N-acetyltransferase